MYNYLVIYRKNNGELLERIRTTLPDAKIGEETPMGWTVENIKFVYDGKIYDTNEELDKAYHKKYRFHKIKDAVLDLVKSHIWKIGYIGWTLIVLLLVYRGV